MVGPTALPLPTIYTGSAVPQTYNPNWRLFTNLTPAQTAAFQAFPQDLGRYMLWRMHQLKIRFDPISPQVAVLAKAIFATPATITTQAQVDAALGVIKLPRPTAVTPPALNPSQT